MNTVARGGTELMAERINTLPPELLSKVNIIHSRFRGLDPSKKNILVLHDLAQDPEVAHLRDGGWKKFTALVFVSHWQQQQYHDYLGVPFSAGFVIPNAIEPMEYHEKPDDKIRLIYFSTPHRGLEILEPVFYELARSYPEIELNVFSSFNLYGWGERDKPYEPMFERLSRHPQVNYSKAVSNERIREELKRSHILAYPSIWPETSCLVLIESMCAGLNCVHSSLAALPETSMNHTMMYPYTENVQEHAYAFYAALRNAIEFAKAGYKMNRHHADTLNHVYSWERRKAQWQNFLTILTA